MSKFAKRISGEGESQRGRSPKKAFVQLVMPGLDPGIHVFLKCQTEWMAGTNPTPGRGACRLQLAHVSKMRHSGARKAEDQPRCRTPCRRTLVDAI
jgi:hypothetical protein